LKRGYDRAVEEPPVLRVYREREPWLVVRPPAEMAPRSWILGVVAVQAGVEGGVVRARLRAHATGEEEAAVMELGGSAVLHVALARSEEALVLPTVAVPALEGAAARIAIYLDGEPLAESVLRTPIEGARAFAHAFCRWLRDGTYEPGFDLTEFLVRSPGAKFDRSLSRPLAPGKVVSWGVAAAAVVGSQEGDG
jgi:hypothetical protein